MTRCGRQSDILARAEKWASGFSLHRGLCCFTVACLAILARLFLLPLIPIPKPVIHDEFSYLLAGETFADGRLTNPSPRLAEFFETFHVLTQPTYMSKYPPGQGVALAAGILLFHDPWYGVLISIGLMCGLICWAIQGWLHPRYGLYGGLFAVLIFGIDHYWVNSYMGGAVAACGGALVLGAMPRLAKRPGMGAAIAAAVGTVILANSRPYEGCVFVCAASAVFLWWTAKRANAKRWRQASLAIPAALILAAGIGSMALYNRAVTGSATTLPYAVYAARYSAVPNFWILPLGSGSPKYRDSAMKNFEQDFSVEPYLKQRRDPFHAIHSVVSLAVHSFDIGAAGPFGFVFLLSLVFARARNTLPLIIILTVFGIGLCMETYTNNLHYAAPVTALFLLLGMQGMRALRLVSIGGKRVGLYAMALVMAAGFGMATLRIPARGAAAESIGPPSALDARWSSEQRLSGEPGQHVVIVRYAPAHSPHEELVYNGPDIDTQKIIWALDKGDAENRRLLAYYPGRRFWLLTPDPPHVSLVPYPN